MEVAQFGPRELRVVRGEGWTLPIYCDPYTSDARSITHWLVRPAIQMLSRPFTELSSRFGPISLSEESTFWVVDAASLEKLSEKVSGCMPKDYMHWDSKPESRDNLLVKVSVNDKDEEFLAYCCKMHSIDMSVGRFVWRAIKEGAQHWLINMQKPIEFELFTIYPIPYRANWKEIQLSKHPGCYKTFGHKRDKWKSMLTGSGFVQDLGSSDLLSMNPDKTFNWTLEVVPTKLWVDSVRDAEKQRLHSKGQLNYARYYESRLCKKLDDILTAFSTWVRQVRIPVAVLRESTNGSGSILVPARKQKRVSPSSYRPPETYFQIGPNSIGLVPGKIGKFKKVPATLKQMYDLSGIPPAIGDVREPDEPIDVGGGTSGLLLPDEGEGENKGQRLLAERTES